MSTTKVTENNSFKVEDKTDWNRLISESQDLADVKSSQDLENPVLQSNKFVKSEKKVSPRK
ncbi:hypothetical protein MO867_16835 [Microbulbifer sp. OS29]|uniref:Uncharacterized protein n=1 Tax=Microbulbifer okhotskensis TaxID=2926617 RepID=A0A9X2J687_9GAMM|nr:hypothetical protein [Microbulbifer okhotskensis]MCO1335998.1 hypothetical protein [Microbulbifer okhotskensis]